MLVRRSCLARCCALALVLTLVPIPSAGAAVVFSGFPAAQEQALRSDLAKSLFPFDSLLDVVVQPDDLSEGVLGLAVSDGNVYLDEDAFSDTTVRTFAFLHELSHQIDYQLLQPAERGLFYSAAGFGDAVEVGDGFTDPDWYDPSRAHAEIPAEQFASAVPLVVWPVSQGNVFVGADGACIGWEGGEGCAAPLATTLAIVNSVLAQHGLPALDRKRQVSKPLLQESFIPPQLGSAPDEWRLHEPIAGVTAIDTSLTALAALKGVRPSRSSVLRVRLAAAGGALPGFTVRLDYRNGSGWWRLGVLETNNKGSVVYRFRPKGWRPTALRVTFIGTANLRGASLVVPVGYGKTPTRSAKRSHRP